MYGGGGLGAVQESCARSLAESTDFVECELTAFDRSLPALLRLAGTRLTADGDRSTATVLFGQSIHRRRPAGTLHVGPAVQIGFDGGDAGAETQAVDLKILHDALHVIARLGDRNALHPVDFVDVGIARIAML